MELVSRMMDGSIAFPARDSLSGPVVLDSDSEVNAEQDQTIRYLQRVPILGDCTKRQLRAIARTTDVLETPAGEVLARAGDRGEQFFFIVDGAVRIEVSPHYHHRIGPGEFFGEMSLLDGEPRSATVIADTTVRLLLIHRREFANLLKLVPTLTRQILVALCQRVRQAEKPLNA